MEIRKVTERDDFDQLGDIYRRSWQAAYAGIVPQDYLDSLTGQRWSAALKHNSRDSFVLEEDGRYLGTSSICAARDPALAGWGEIISIYLLPECFGRGLGKPLLERSLAALRDRGFSDIYLWVLEDNARARRFYEKQSFTPSDHTQTISIGGRELREIRYVWNATTVDKEEGLP